MTNTTVTENKEQKKLVRSVFWRTMWLMFCTSYTKQQGTTFAWTMIPYLEDIYGKETDEFYEAMSRHQDFFNTTPGMSPFIFSLVITMEQERKAALDAGQNFDDAAIEAIKVALMGPLAGIGDSFFWGTLRVIATGIGTSLALQGNILGPILFLLVFNVPHLLVRYFAMMSGYRLGAGVLDKIQKSGLMESLTYGAAILGLMVIGGMTAEMVTVNIPLQIGTGDSAMAIADILNGIVPGIMPLAFTGFIYLLLSKNFKTTTILVIIAIIGIVGAFFGFLA